MKDEFLFLWAQWGILNLHQMQVVLKHFGDFERAWKEVTPEFLRQLGMRFDKAQRVFEIRDKLSFSATLDVVQQFGIQLYFWEDEAYPAPLKALETAPPFLFVRGKLPSFHKSIAIVGTRSMSAYGQAMTERFTSDLIREGFVVVSGLARGVDSVAHRTTLQNGGRTVAVMGTGVDLIYPSSNHRLAQEILESGGALMSSFPLGTPGLAHHFPKRNSIVAGLTRGTLVIEGGVKSGALITARLALDYGREVFAVPGNVTQLALSGTNHLIRNTMAKLVENAEHVLEDFGMQVQAQAISHDFSKAERSILEQLTTGPKNMDELLAQTVFDVPQLSELLIYLQLKSAVAQQGERWSLV